MNIRRKASITALALSLYLGLTPLARASDEDDVRAAFDREQAGWAKHDAKQVASVYTSDTIWQNPFGVRLHGSAQVERFLTNLFQRPGYLAATVTNPVKIIDLRITAPGVAVVWSMESSEGQIDDSTGKPMAPRKSYYLEVFVKQDQAWKVSDSIIMDVIPHQ